MKYFKTLPQMTFLLKPDIMTDPKPGVGRRMIQIEWKAVFRGNPPEWDTKIEADRIARWERATGNMTHTYKEITDKEYNDRIKKIDKELQRIIEDTNEFQANHMWREDSVAAGRGAYFCPEDSCVNLDPFPTRQELKAHMNTKHSAEKQGTSTQGIPPSPEPRDPNPESEVIIDG